MALAKILLPTVLGIGGVIGSGVFYYILDLKNEISLLTDKLKTSDSELVKVKADLLMQNTKLIQQANRIMEYNNIAPLYKQSIENKYAGITGSDKCEKNLDSINEIFTRQRYNYGKDY